jgi:hypothetical protein
MYEQVIAGVGLALLLVLCLPFAGVQKLVLGVYAWALRLALLALLGASAYLWFCPDLPVEVTDTLANFPGLMAVLPEPGTPYFGISAATFLVAVFLPLLAVLDVCRKLAGGRLRIHTVGLGAEAPLPAGSAPQRTASPAPRRADRRAAADAMAEAGSHKPSRFVDRLES